jgi:hypothetical protein
MNAEATALGLSLNVFLVGSTLVPAASAAFLHYEPTCFLRPFTVPHSRYLKCNHKRYARDLLCNAQTISSALPSRASRL